MAKEALDLWSEELVTAFRSAGPDVSERSIFGGRAFLVGDALVGVVETVSGQLRVRFRDELRPDLEARSHFEPQSPLPMLLIVTDDDRDYARSLVRKAYERAKDPAPARPAPEPQATTIEPTRRRRTR
jgi:TfoX/Sxy family transcriptional regulator of competence genes